MTPDDELVWIGYPGLFRPEVDEVRVSVLFTWDRDAGRDIAQAWTDLGYQTELGGPAFDAHGEEFTPGLYVKHGVVITSRGCPNRCWFCYVPKREGAIRELPITEGWNVQDNNLLACSEAHINAVFDMLAQQPRRPEFGGGLDARYITPSIAERIVKLKPRTMYLAYDTPDDLPHVLRARELFLEAGYSPRSHAMSCYVLIGYPRDTMEAAQARLEAVRDAGLTPFAMLYRDNKGRRDHQWMRFTKYWVRQHAIWGEKTPKRERNIAQGSLF